MCAYNFVVLKTWDFVYDPQFDQTKVSVMTTSVRSPGFSVHCRFSGVVQVVKAVRCNH